MTTSDDTLARSSALVKLAPVLIREPVFLGAGPTTSILHKGEVSGSSPPVGDLNGGTLQQVYRAKRYCGTWSTGHALADARNSAVLRIF